MGLPLIPLDSCKDVKAIDDTYNWSFIHEDQIKDRLLKNTCFIIVTAPKNHANEFTMAKMNPEEVHLPSRLPFLIRQLTNIFRK
ncbi:MAG: hypothetical protein ACFE9D_07415 [Promethearchaeota archaeon]